jgi:hypothetical protein
MIGRDGRALGRGWSAVAAAVWLCAVEASPAVPPDSPKAFLIDLYTHYTDEDAPVLDWSGEDGPRLFEPRLAAAIATEARESGERGEVSGVLDYDPFVQGQDYEITALKIAVVESQARAAKLLVTFRNAGRPTAVRFELVRLESGWRIRDMRWGKTSLWALCMRRPK